MTALLSASLLLAAQLVPQAAPARPGVFVVGGRLTAPGSGPGVPELEDEHAVRRALRGLRAGRGVSLSLQPRSGSQAMVAPPTTTAAPAGPQAGASAQPTPDCNRNGIPDVVEVGSGAVADCNLDGVPDECQLAVEGVYLHDDRLQDGSAAYFAQHYGWFTQYTTRPGEEIITEVELGRGVLTAGTPVTVGIWSDPDGDETPADAQLLTSVQIVPDWSGSGSATRVNLPDTNIGPAGTSFFVGVLGTFDGLDRPIAYDAGAPSDRSWLIASSAPLLVDTPAVGAGTLGTINDVDVLVRAISCPSGRCGELTDFDFDGVPDACQPQDCNANGVPDDQDLAAGTSQDCQADGIPDECQTQLPSVIYTVDSGWNGIAVGTNHDYIAWLSPFVVQPGGEIISHIDVAWGGMPPGGDVNLVLWSDPNGDGDPTDAQVILEFPTQSSFEFTGEWVAVNIPDTFVGPAGTSFFAGAYGVFPYDPANLPVSAPAGFDADTANATAWWISADAPIDLDNLSAGAAEYGRLNTVCSCDGNWNLRPFSCPGGRCGESDDINQNGQPDECDPDCDGDLLPDDYEIAFGLDTDCDGSGVPDSCEVLADCDGNRIPDVCQAVAPGGLVGEYFAGPDAAGTPLSRIDSQVAFDFTVTPPPAGLFPTSFSARWTGSVVTAAPGVHTFKLLHGGGARLWVNGVILIDERSAPQGALTESANTIELLGQTEYLIRLEYSESGGVSALELSWQPPGGSMAPIPASSLRPIYDRNQDGVPDTCQLLSDCNGNLVEDLDDIAGGTSLDCNGDSIPDECQLCEDGDGNGVLDACELSAGPGLVGQYFLLDSTTREFRHRIRSQVDPVIDFDWLAGAPTGLQVDAFGVRWTGTLTTPAVSGSYTFTAQANDGVRVWLDEVKIIEGWGSSGLYSANVNLGGSTSHLLRVEYRETGGNARVNLSWTVPGQASVTIPSGALAPDSDVDGDGVTDFAVTDCNLNGVPDALDTDLNGNCLPDDCEGGAGYWRFEEAGGATALDSTPSGLNGVLIDPAVRIAEVPLPVVPQTGAPNLQALDNGFVGAVEVTDPIGLLSVPGNSFTLEAWVRLEVISSTNSANQRQWLFMNKPASNPDTQLEFGFLVQAGDLGPTGRELALRYGDGSNVQGVVSSLKFPNYGQEGAFDWHFVSLVYDADRSLLRFGLDGEFETIPFRKPPVANPGRLLLGSHENASGVRNQWLFGAVDEARFSRLALPPEALLD